MRKRADAARDEAAVATADDALGAARLFERIVEHCPDCFWTTSLEADGSPRVRYVSPGWSRIWGWPAEAIYADAELWHKAIVEDDRRRAREAFDDVRRGEGARTVRYRIRSRDGAVRWIEDRMSPIVDESGRVVGLDGIARDISVQRRTEDALLRSERQLRQLSDAIREVFWLTDWTERRVLHVSPAYETIWGRSCASLYAEPRSWAEAIHPDDRAAAVAAFERDAERGAYDVRYRVVRPDGSVRWIHDRAFPLCDEDGRVVRLAGVSEDITERVAVAERERTDRARLEREVRERTASLTATNERLETEIEGRRRVETALRRSEQRFRSVLAAVPDLILVLDAAGRYVDIFTADHELLAAPPEKLLGRTIHEVFSPETAAGFQAVIDRAIETGELQRTEYPLVLDGTTRWFAGRVVRFGPADDPSVLWVARDISARRGAERELVAHQERLRSLASELSLAEERERRRIAADLHDHIAQNLGLARMRLEVLRSRGGDAPELEAALDLIQGSIRDTRSLMFDLSPPMLYDLGFEPAVEWLVEQHQHRATDLAIAFEDDGAGKPLDEGLRVILFRAVRELLVNVAKHARAGEARVRLARAGDDIRIDVVDDGVGFPAPPRADAPSEAAGFGLFSIREQLGRHGGRLEVVTAPGSGARVTIIAPLARPERKDPP